MLTLGDRLAKMRKRAGKTQKQMAERLDIATRTWRDYERDTSEISPSKLIKAALFCRENPVRIFESFFTVRNTVTKASQ